MASSKYLTKPFTLSSSDIQRIFSRVDIDSPDGCWLWTGARDRLGYGYVRYQGTVVNLHRLVFAWLVAPLSDKGRKGNAPVLHHVCENPSCCNPAHLKLMSHCEHMRLSDGFGGKNYRKTHCSNGHLLPPKIEGQPRRCLICYKAKKDAYSLSHRDEAIARAKAWKIAHKKVR